MLVSKMKKNLFFQTRGCDRLETPSSVGCTNKV